MKWVGASAAALGLSSLDLLKLEEALASSTSPPVIWLQGSSCTGCSISLLNVTNPTINDVLLNTISMKYHPNLNAAAGELAVSTIIDNSNIHNGHFILCIEGGIPTGASGNYCVIARRDGQNWSMLSAINDLGPKARFVIAVGTCATFGGVVRPSSHTEIRSVRDILAGKTRNTIINLPGCPTHPNTTVGTIVDLLTTGLPSLDSEFRPIKYYKDDICEKCPRDNAPEVNRVGVFGCYDDLDCRGEDTVSNCPIHRWNNGVNWCIGANMVCIGCASKDFPRRPLYKYS
jgi:hydrogenase small subunit